MSAAEGVARLHDDASREGRTSAPPSAPSSTSAHANSVTTFAPSSAFRASGKIAKLGVFETETFPAEEIKLFAKELLCREALFLVVARSAPCCQADWAA
jgi:hypothetical protein